MPSVLCTGGTGFVGSHVVQNLLERRQYKVHILARRGSRVPAIAFGAHLIEGDVERPEDINAALRAAQPEYVFHLAGVYAWWQRDPDRFERVNVDAVRSLVAACSCHAHEIGRRVKLVHVSTPLAYGVPASGQGHAPQTAIDEETLPGAPSSRYARSKRAGDLIAQAAFEGGELDGCTCLLACCIGADPKLLDPERDVMRIKELTQGRVPATITSDTVFTYVAVRDAAEAIVRAAEKRGNERGERYLIGNQRLRTADYYALIAELSGQPPPRYEVPAWLAIGAAHLASAYASYVSGSAPTAPADLVRTATRGTLLFDASKSERELGMVYTAIRSAFAEAVDLVTSPASSGVHVPDDHADAAAGLLADAD